MFVIVEELPVFFFFLTFLSRVPLLCLFFMQHVECLSAVFASLFLIDFRLILGVRTGIAPLGGREHDGR